MAPWRPRSPTEGCCREDRAHEEGRGDARIREGEERSPSSQASPWPWPATGIEEQGSLMAQTDEPVAGLSIRIPKDLHRRLRLHCVTHEIAVQDFVTQAIEEKLGRKTGPKKGTA